LYHTEGDGSSLKNSLLLAFNYTSVSNYYQNAAETFENDNASRGKNIAHIYTRFRNAHENIFFWKDKDNRYFISFHFVSFYLTSMFATIVTLGHVKAFNTSFQKYNCPLAHRIKLGQQ
jgi:hypothetical protein